MKRKKVSITVMQIMYGLLLKFGKINEADLNIAIKQLDKIAYIDFEQCTEYYFVTSDGFVILNPVSIDKIYKTMNNNKIMENQSILVRDYLNNLSLSELVLRKVKLYGWVSIEMDEILDNFSISQVIELKRLLTEGYLISYFEEECICDSYRAVRLTQKGEVDLFMIDNFKKIDAFLKTLEIEYSEETEKIVKAFLMTQNFSLNVRKILTVDNFICFYKGYHSAFLDEYKLKRTTTN